MSGNIPQLIPDCFGCDIPRVIQVGINNWLGSYSSNNPEGPFNQFAYYKTLQRNLSKCIKSGIIVH